MLICFKKQSILSWFLQKQVFTSTRGRHNPIVGKRITALALVLILFFQNTGGGSIKVDKVQYLAQAV